jgi:lipopolysaccharide export system protein LptC
MSRWPWLLVLLGSILLFLSISDRRSTKVPEPNSPTLAGEPDLYMAKATITQYADDGTISYRLWSDETRHFESEDVTRLVSPTLTFNRAPQSSWSASAKQGLVNYKDTPDGKPEEVVALSGDVRLQSTEPPNPIDITCASLLIYPDRQFAETDQPVMITGNSGSTSAVGLSGDLNSGLFNLSSSTTQRVHNVVLPGQFKHTPVQSPH